MGLIACPTCTTANNDARTICRQCGTNLKGLKYGSAPVNGRGRISFDTPHATDLEGACSIPVLIDGRPSGVSVLVAVNLSHHPIAETVKDHYRDTKAIVFRALAGGRRRKV